MHDKMLKNINFTFKVKKKERCKNFGDNIKYFQLMIFIRNLQEYYNILSREFISYFQYYFYINKNNLVILIKISIQWMRLIYYK